ncbi:hypothetical protein KAW65_00635 [candidate division WOR-3 bacterium]|nr:hypothetical protein [candidate division WOR-3 bacterium]
MKTKGFNRTHFLDYYKRADEFFKAMSDEVNFGRYNASALLGIHASIALTDSLTIYESEKRASDEQHMDAVKLLKSVCNTKGISKDGPNRLGKILSKKSFIAYGERFRAMDTEKLKSIRLNVERFFTWAYRNFEYLKGG